MKTSLSLLIACACGAAASGAAAQSSAALSGGLQVALTRGNGGTTPIDGLGANKTALNDPSSCIELSGTEGLGAGLYAGFQLRSFTAVDTGASSTPFWAARSVVKLGGSFGELYAGSSFTPAAWMAPFADPWYWGGSAAQVGWQIQQAAF